MHVAGVTAAAMAAGALHVVSGPDHLTAVLPLALAQRGRAVAVGAWWGIGHGLGVAVLTGLGAVTMGVLDLSSFAGVCEALVGGLLMFMGVRALRRGARADAGRAHAHLGPAGPAELGGPGTHHHGALGFGMLHGAAGGGHLLAVLPALTLSPAATALYVAAYLGGAALSMSLFAMLCGGLVPDHRIPMAMRGAGALAIATGIFWIGAAVSAAWELT